MRWLYYINKWRDIPNSTDRLLYKQVREYRDKYPEKAHIMYIQGVGPLPILMADGAYAIYQQYGLHTNPSANSFDQFVRAHLSDILYQITPSNSVLAAPENNWSLAIKGEIYLLYSLAVGAIRATLEEGNYQSKWFDQQGNELVGSGLIAVAKRQEQNFKSSQGKPALLLLKRFLQKS